MTKAASRAWNLLGPNNLSGDLTDDFVNNFIAFFGYIIIIKVFLKHKILSLETILGTYRQRHPHTNVLTMQN